MENRRPALGPLPTPPPEALPPTRAAVLAAVGAQGSVTMRVLAQTTGLHANTLREHLDLLVASGHVRRTRVPTGGRGRPPWAYEASGARPDIEPAGLAAALVGHVRRTSTDVRGDALAAGIGWGRQVAREAAGDGSRATGHDRLVELLDRTGFGPVVEAGDDVVRLTRCPLLELAVADPEVVCSVHLGLVRGALTELGASNPESAELLAFAEPGACRLELAATTGTS